MRGRRASGTVRFLIFASAVLEVSQLLDCAVLGVRIDFGGKAEIGFFLSIVRTSYFL